MTLYYYCFIITIIIIYRCADKRAKSLLWGQQRNVKETKWNNKPQTHTQLKTTMRTHMWIPINLFSPCGTAAQRGAMASSFLRLPDHTQRRTTVGRIPLDEWSARRRDLYLTTHNTHNRQTSMPPVGFDPTISAGERPQTYALYRAATGTGEYL